MGTIKDNKSDPFLDLKLINILVNSKKDLSDFVLTATDSVFLPEYRRFVKQVILYHNTFDSCPTLDTLIEYGGKNNSDLVEYLKIIWNDISKIKTDNREFSFLFDKLKKRYNLGIIRNLKLRLDSFDDDIENGNELIHQISSEIKSIGTKKVYKEINLKNYVDDWKLNFKAKLNNPEIAQGMLTGFSMMDYYTNGMRPGELLLIAGPTGGGKTIMLLNLAVNMYMGKNQMPETFDKLVEFCDNNVWKKAYNVLFISIEMLAEEVIDRVISNMASVDSLKFGKPNEITKDEAERIKKALYYWENSPSNLKVIECPRGITMANIQNIYDDVCQEFIPDIVIIDYLGIMIDNEAKTEQDWEKLKNISEEMHEFGRHNKVLVATGVQLTEVKPGEGGIGLHRIGRSRMVAHNCNLVLQIESRLNEDNLPDSRVHCIKFRRGPKFVMSNLRKDFKYTRFTDMGLPIDKKQLEENSNSKEPLPDVIDELFGDMEA